MTRKAVTSADNLDMVFTNSPIFRSWMSVSTVASFSACSLASSRRPSKCPVYVPVGEEVGCPVGGPGGGAVGCPVGGPVGGEVGFPVDGPVGGEVGTPRG